MVMYKYAFLFIPVFFSVIAQLLIKQAALKEVNSVSWMVIMAGSILTYLLAFFFYSYAVRLFPVSLASPVNTIMVMLLVVTGGVLIWGEPWGIQRTVGVALGVLSLIILLSSE